MVNGAFEDFAIDGIRSPYETNSCLIRTIQEVLPIKRTQKSGTIVNISPRAGKIGYPLALLNEVQNLQGQNGYFEMKLKCQGCTLSYDKMNH